MEIVNLKGRKSKALEPGEVYCGRAMYRGGWKLPASKWANPFAIKQEWERDQVIEQYREYLLTNEELMDSLEELSGKTLACWCAPKKCHCEVIREVLSEVLEEN